MFENPHKKYHLTTLQLKKRFVSLDYVEAHAEIYTRIYETFLTDFQTLYQVSNQYLTF